MLRRLETKGKRLAPEAAPVIEAPCQIAKGGMQNYGKTKCCPRAEPGLMSDGA